MRRSSHATFGVALLAFATIATGLVNLIWGAFDPEHQPIQAFGGNVPGAHPFAYVAGLALVAGGAMILRRRTARIGGTALAIVYCIVTVFWLPRLITAPPILGYNISTYLGVAGGIFSTFLPAVAAWLVVVSLRDGVRPFGLAVRTARWIVGMASLVFGCNHLVNTAQLAVEVPHWMPFGSSFWTLLTGICFILAGIAIASGVLDVLAACLLGTMFIVFNAVMLIPEIFASPHDEGTWGGNAFNLAVAAAPLILADLLAAEHAQRARNQF